jgi:sigma-54-specific transcriptional regulator
MLTVADPQALALSVRASCFVLEDPLSKAIEAQARRIAPSDATALIIDETGTGKELIARHIHSLSRRLRESRSVCRLRKIHQRQ